MVKNKKGDDGMSLDDAFEDDDDVEYSESKMKTVKKKNNMAKKKEFDETKAIKIINSKPIGNIKKGDKIKVNGKEYEVDAHYILIDHGTTKEMVIDIFDKKADKDYEIRYFSDQVETSLEFYELVEIMYNRIGIESVEW